MKTEETIAVKEHSYGEVVIIKKATKTEEGLKTQTCAICGDVKEEIIPVTSEQSDGGFV